jgi:acyl-coenzyme A thioesterase 13
MGHFLVHTYLIHTYLIPHSQRFSSALYNGTPSTPGLSLLSVTTPTPTTSLVSFAYTPPSYYSNPLGNLHGAAHALIYDNCTTLALAAIAKPGFWMLGGVSRVLDVKYVRGLRVGEKVTVETEVVHVGRQAAAIRGVIKDGRGRVCSTCEHDKTNIDPPPEEKAKL